MKRKKLANLTNELLSHNKECSVTIDVWHPTIDDIRRILKLGHDKIDPNSSSESCTIYDILFDRYMPAKAPAFRVVLYCNDVEGRFMYEYVNKTKKGGE